MLQNATPLRKSAPWPPNISDEHVFCTVPATRNASLKILLKCPTPASVFGNATKPPPLQKCSVPFSFFALLTSKCASRHNGVHFFNIWTSKSGPTLRCFVHFLRNVLRATTACTFSTSQLPKGPTLRCFVHFDFETCFAPQRRALFRHLNFQKCSETQVFCTFWLANVLRATTACNFSSLIWPAGSAPAALASLLFDPPELSYLFSHLHLLSSVYSFSSTLLSSNLSLLSASSLLCFSSVHIVGSLTLNFLRICLRLRFNFAKLFVILPVRSPLAMRSPPENL